MSRTGQAQRIEDLFARCSCAFGVFLFVLAIGCGDSQPPTVPPPGGSGGSSGSAGSGGMAGGGGVGGMAGIAGTGGMAGIGGSGGSGASAGAGGSAGGTGGVTGACVTNALCHTCPSEASPPVIGCSADADCGRTDYVCVPSGCKTHGGAPLGQCQPLASPSCDPVDDDPACPNEDDYDCVQVGGASSSTYRCLRVSGDCTPTTQSYDCAPGFSCEGSTCVDRRVPCVSTIDCPKSHVCHTWFGTGSFCIGVYRTCETRGDCLWAGVNIGADCADVDGDLRKECTGTLTPPAEPCVNALCSDTSQVCENGAAGQGVTAICGDYGLCINDDDCRSGFECAELWQDGRKECVPTSGPSDDCLVEPTNCPLHRVCAAPRNGGRPSCQAGKE
jgi:hypothetical protein